MKSGLRLPATVAACLFDLDGVLTRTAELHAEAWKDTFDDFLHKWSTADNQRRAPFDAVADYEDYVDGKPRLDGVRSFLASRGIELREGSKGDPTSADTIHGLAQRKNELVRKLMEQRGVNPYEGSVRFIEAAQRAGLDLAVVTSSENADAVLRAAGLAGYFHVVVDGAIATALGLHGKPAPDVFLEASRRVGAEPAHAAVFEDALAGVAAGHAGGFAVVVGVDRADRAAELLASGADVLVRDLSELIS